jgi:pimeloyl-ACP methyl ester carboxylesterase
MQLEDWRQAGQTFEFQGHPVFYRTEGEGPVLVCIHGFPTASWDWHAVWPALAERFQVIAPDMIGFGYSAKPQDFSYSILDQAEMHEALLASLGISDIHILAHDYGDTVTQELLARYLERQAEGKSGLKIRSACLLNGGLFPETHRARPIQKLLMSPVGPVLARLYNERSFRRSFLPIFGPDTQPSEHELRDFWSLIHHNNGTRVAHQIIRYMQERVDRRERWVGALQDAAMPVRLINGPLDPVSGAHMLARFRELIPDADIVTLEGIGHYPQVEDPEGVLAAYWEFLQDNFAATSGL